MSGGGDNVDGRGDLDGSHYQQDGDFSPDYGGRSASSEDERRMIPVEENVTSNSAGDVAAREC